jgi:hypothetical protein
VDDDTGIPFYNDCLASCQLGARANLKRAAAVQAAAAAATAATSRKASSGASDAADAADTTTRNSRVLGLLPPPSKKNVKEGEQGRG